MLRTINNTIRTLLFHAHLPPSYWVEALHMSTHLLNILPSSSIQNDTPHFRLFHRHPTYTHLRVFGCLCFPNITAPHKLAPRSTPCIFLGYPSDHRGFRCLNLSNQKIIISRHVVFDETILPFGSVTPTHSPSYDFLDPPSPLFRPEFQVTPPVLPSDLANPPSITTNMSDTFLPASPSTSSTQPTINPPVLTSSSSSPTPPQAA